MLLHLASISLVGEEDGIAVVVGSFEGENVGERVVGDWVGEFDGETDGGTDGEFDGGSVGERVVGDWVGKSTSHISCSRPKERKSDPNSSLSSNKTLQGSNASQEASK